MRIVYHNRLVAWIKSCCYIERYSLPDLFEPAGGVIRILQHVCQEFPPPQDVILKETVYCNLIGHHFLQVHDNKSLLLVKCGDIVNRRL